MRTLNRGLWCAVVWATVAMVGATACKDEEPGGDAGADQGETPDTGAGDMGVDPDVGGGQDVGTDPDAGEPDAGGADGGITPPEELEGDWSTEFTAPGMQSPIGARVNAVVRSADGDIYAGGIFTAVGPTAASGVARWTGSDWEPLAYGVLLDVEALALDGAGTLYAAGRATGGGIGIGGSNGIWAWNGTEWSELATVDGEFSTVSALFVTPEGHLVAGGSFDGIGSTATPNLAVYDGMNWSPLGGSPDGPVRTIEPVGEELCIGGEFLTVGDLTAEFVACHGTEGWSARPGLPGHVADLLYTSTGALLAGGTLTFTDFSTGDYVAGVAQWTGDTWEIFQGGVDGGFINEVRALAESDAGDIYVGGTFGLVGKGLQDLDATNVARWDGTAWHALGDGVINSVGVVIGSVVGINDFVFDGDRLVAGGLFSRAGTTGALNIATWDGEAWSPMVNPGQRFLGVNGVVNTLVEVDGGIVAAGFFDHVGDTSAMNVAYLKDGAWESVASGLQDVVFDAAHDGQSLYVAGSFADVQPTGASFVARRDGPVWRGLGAGPNDTVSELLAVGPGDLYVGGDFTEVGTLDANHVARWKDGAWTALGDGLDGRVTALHVGADGVLYAGGNFETAGDGTVVNHVARFIEGKWKPLVEGLDGRVAAIVSVGDDIIVGGTFAFAGDVRVDSLARWDGTAWSRVGPGLTPDLSGVPITVSQLHPWQGGFFVTGTFVTIEESFYAHIAYWNGDKFLPLGSGMSDLPEDVLFAHGSLWVAGGFTSLADGRPSYGLARWDSFLDTAEP